MKPENLEMRTLSAVELIDYLVFSLEQYLPLDRVCTIVFDFKNGRYTVVSDDIADFFGGLESNTEPAYGEQPEIAWPGTDSAEEAGA